MKIRPVSRTPRRLTRVMSTRMPRHSASVCACSLGTAETRAPTPAEMPTATTKNVVNHQSSGSKEAGRNAEILARDSVRSTATGVCLDRLTVREINDGEQHDDAGADRNNIGNSRRAKRNEQRQGSLRAVGRGTEGIQAEDRNPSCRADALGAGFVRRERPPQKQIQNSHTLMNSLGSLHAFLTCLCFSLANAVSKATALFAYRILKSHAET